jgi:hypothetical protein
MLGYLGLDGVTRGELGLVLFVFGIVYVAAFVPRAGASIGRRLAGGRKADAGAGGAEPRGNP